jgi:hypothetical protein
LKTDDLRLGGSNGSTSCFCASLTRSACRRSEICGARQRPVSGFRQGRKGFGGRSSAGLMEVNGFSGGGVEVASTVGAFGFEVDGLEVVYARGLEDGAVDGSCNDFFGRVSGMDAPVNFAE